MMKIINLEHIESIVLSAGLVKGSVYAYTNGYVNTDFGSADAGAIAYASGLWSLTYAGTSTQAAFNPYYFNSQAFANGYAIGADGSSKATSSFYGSSDSIGFMGNSMTIGTTISTSMYQSW